MIRTVYEGFNIKPVTRFILLAEMNSQNEKQTARMLTLLENTYNNMCSSNKTICQHVLDTIDQFIWVNVFK